MAPWRLSPYCEAHLRIGGVWVCTNLCTAWERQEDAPMGRHSYDPWKNMHPKAWFCWPECPSGCIPRLSALRKPQPWAWASVAHGLLSSLGSVLTGITLRPGGLSWGREEYNFLIVQSISFPAAGLNLFLSEVLSVCINHLSLYVFVAVATAWLIEFHSVFLDFKAMIKSHSTTVGVTTEAEGAVGAELKWHVLPLAPGIPEQRRRPGEPSKGAGEFF